MNKIESIMTYPLRLFCILLSAVLLSLGIPNEVFKHGSALLTLIALVPLFTALLRTRKWSEAGFSGGLMMLVVHLLSSFWLANFKEFAIFTLGGSGLVTCILGIPVGWGLKKAASLKPAYRPAVFAAVWTVWEFAKSSGFLAYPWGTLYMGARNLYLPSQIADITGAWGMSFLCAYVSACLAELTLALPAKRFGHVARNSAFAVVLFAAATLYGIVRLETLPESIDTADVVLVQQNADSWESGGVRNALIASQSLTRQGIAQSRDRPDLVVWSESVLAYPYLPNKDWYRRNPAEDPFVPFLKEIGIPLLVGSPVLVDEVREDYSNSVICLAPDGRQTDWYAKMQLVPFAEYMPFTEYEFVRKFFDAIVGFSSGWKPGDRLVALPFTLKSGREIRFAAPICFEDAFAFHVSALVGEGADLIINLTNDSWSKTESAEYQHFSIAWWRAVELRRPLIRSTNAGYTVVVEPSGRIAADLPLFTPASLPVRIAIYPRTPTFYGRFGDWLPALLGAVLLSLFLITNPREHPELL
ncbi:MAG: Apolipoprotein N-acyltransferase [Spirochaetes bacterium ADurb.Bin269]|nr:MAG: Apolipoprotein N-acyltransferase [Spirochaetes bacterium ADurb.Bin269]